MTTEALPEIRRSVTSAQPSPSSSKEAQQSDTKDEQQRKKGKLIRIFRNGDVHFAGQRMLVQGTFMSFTTFLDQVTKAIHSAVAVERLYSVRTGRRVRSLADIEHRQCYVAARKKERMRTLPYMRITRRAFETTRRHSRVPDSQGFGYAAPVRTLMRRPSRAFAWADKYRPINIMVVRNGEKTGTRLLLTQRDMLTFDQVFRHIETRVPFDNDCIVKIVTPAGEEVDDLGFFREGAVFITVGRKSRFKKRMYARLADELALRLPPVVRIGRNRASNRSSAGSQQPGRRQSLLTRRSLESLAAFSNNRGGPKGSTSSSSLSPKRSRSHSVSASFSGSESTLSPYSVLPPIVSPENEQEIYGDDQSSSNRRVSFGPNQMYHDVPDWWDDGDSDAGVDTDGSGKARDAAPIVCVADTDAHLSPEELTQKTSESSDEEEEDNEESQSGESDLPDVVDLVSDANSVASWQVVQPPAKQEQEQEQEQPDELNAQSPPHSKKDRKKAKKNKKKHQHKKKVVRRHSFSDDDDEDDSEKAVTTSEDEEAESSDEDDAEAEERLRQLEREQRRREKAMLKKAKAMRKLKAVDVATGNHNVRYKWKKAAFKLRQREEMIRRHANVTRCFIKNCPFHSDTS